MGDDNPFERNMDLQDAEDDVRRYAVEEYPRVDFPPNFFTPFFFVEKALVATA